MSIEHLSAATPKYPRLATVLPAWIAFVLYLPTLGHGFAWDDIYFLVDMPHLRDPTLWWDAVRQPLFVSVDYFRPLPLLAFVLETRVGEGQPFVFHLVNIVLHAANTLLVVRLAQALVGQQQIWPAALAGVLFAVHPALVENVAWISDRFDLLMVFFVLAALGVQHALGNTFGRNSATAALFLAALLCKETGVVLLALLPIWRFLLASRQQTVSAALAETAREWRLVLALVIALALYLTIRVGALGYLYVGDAQMTPGSAIQHLLLIGKTLGWYVLLAFWPFGLVNAAHPGITPIAVDDALAWAGLAGISSLTGLIIWGILCGRQRTLLLLCAMALLSLAPVSNLVPLTIGDNLISDRYLILPVAFVAIAVASLLANSRAKVRWILILAWCIACSVATWLQIPDWANNLTLWQAAYARTPSSEIARQNYLSALVTDGHYARAEALAKEFLAQGPQPTSVSHNLALAQTHTGKLTEAEATISEVLQRPYSDTPFNRLGRSEALNLLAAILIAQERYESAKTHLLEAIALTPQLGRPYHHLALVHYAQGELSLGDQAAAMAARLSHVASTQELQTKRAAARASALARNG